MFFPTTETTKRSRTKGTLETQRSLYDFYTTMFFEKLHLFGF